MGRSVSAGTVVRDQVDIYQPIGSFKRVAGILAPSVTPAVFVDNLSITWPIQDGTNVADSSISSGAVYFNEIPGSPGFYAVRFFPDRTGFWRVIFSLPVYGLEIVKEYDVIPSLPGPSSPNSLNATFIKQ